ncbi:hypothetical protein VT84_23460 [Gemmata sp. SH-PL17]|uniref:hypothetical protein n=1 Tax=Gemmata sp. SH-PL17 TaxID=1630693 RepID=UPI00078CE894|nr:hypothetical protein [Gemmata sp. SH-PL17]AMV27377.1 hypothetical protein VT84_23460 [Gemmata sp. SH-PL17]
MEPELIRAEITGVSSGLYSWEERTTNYTTGADVAPASVRKGTTSLNPAVEINGATVPTGTKVWLRRRGYVGGQMYYEFQYEPPAGSSGITGNFSQIGTNYTILTDNTWENTGITLSLPGAGTYLIQFNSNVYLNVSAITTPSSNGTAIQTRFYDVTAGTAINQSVTFAGRVETVNRPMLNNFLMSCVFTASGAKTLRVEALRYGGNTWATSIINNGTNLASIGYLKL